MEEIINKLPQQMKNHKQYKTCIVTKTIKLQEFEVHNQHDCIHQGMLFFIFVSVCPEINTIVPMFLYGMNNIMLCTLPKKPDFSEPLISKDY